MLKETGRVHSYFILAMLLVAFMASSCGSKYNLGGSTPSDDGGGVTPTVPVDAPTPIEFNSVGLDKSSSVMSMSEFSLGSNSLLTPISSCSDVQNKFAAYDAEFADVSFTPTEGTETSYSATVGSSTVVMDFSRPIAGYECSGNASTTPVCVTVTVDGNVAMAMVINDFNDDDWVQWVMMNPNGSTFADMIPSATNRSSLLYIKITHAGAVITYEWKGNAEWDDLMVADLNATCTIYRSIWGQLIAKLYKNDWYGDELKLNAGVVDGNIAVIGDVNAPTGAYNYSTCLDSDGSVVASSNCTDISSLAYVSAPTNIAANEVLAVSGVSATVGDEQNTISWTASDGASSYNVYWSTSSGVTKSSGTKISGITSTSYTHSGLTNGVDYYYVITAVFSDGVETPESLEVVSRPQVNTVGTLLFASVFNSPADKQDVIIGVATDDDSNIYATGLSDDSTDTPRLILMKYDSSGDLDTTFGDDYGADGTDDGYTLFVAPSGYGAEGTSISLDSSGNPLVVGEYGVYNEYGFYPQMAIWSYLSDGDLDTTFHSPDGYIIDPGSGTAERQVTDSSDRIDIVGSYSSSLSVWRYDGDELDSTFSADGLYTHLASGYYAGWGEGISLDENGKIVIAGYLWPSNEDHTSAMIIERLLPEGTLDVGSETTRGFGADYDEDGFADGYIIFDQTDDDSSDTIAYKAYGVTVGPTGKIWVVGTYTPDLQPMEGIVWRYGADGTLDATFGESNGDGTRKGYTRLSVDGTSVFIQDLAFDAYGKIIVGGRRGADAAVWKLDTNGDLDSDFGEGLGYILYGVDNGKTDQPNAMKLDRAGNVIMGGWQYSSGDLATGDTVVWKVE